MNLLDSLYYSLLRRTFSDNSCGSVAAVSHASNRRSVTRCHAVGFPLHALHSFCFPIGSCLNRSGVKSVLIAGRLRRELKKTERDSGWWGHHPFHRWATASNCRVDPSVRKAMLGYRCPGYLEIGRRLASRSVDESSGRGFIALFFFVFPCSPTQFTFHFILWRSAVSDPVRWRSTTRKWTSTTDWSTTTF